MTRVGIANDSFDVDPGVIAQGLQLDPSAIPEMMKNGEITSACERGEGADMARYRLSFFQ